jgi:hypothetical protein
MAYSVQSREELTAGLESNLDNEVCQGTSLDEDKAAEITDPEAMTIKDLRRQVEEAEKEVECQDLVA